MDTLTVNRRTLLEFMNGGGSTGHHTAVAALLGEPLAVGLLLHFLGDQGFGAECVSTKVTQGTRSGERLDAWIAAEKDGRRVLYQTEIKMWAGNAIGGLRLAEDADEATLAKGAARQWARIWNPQTQDFLAPNVRKVLKPMKPPASHEEWPIKPLACFWWLMRSRPTDGPWFTVEVGEAAKSPFAEVHVFSLTAYLLTLDDEVLSLHLPLLRERLEVVGTLLGTPERHWTETFRALSRADGE
ncbi:hypothetical protein [uncultured Deinococcus sp.]|uniref:hypothetical protein n=1 Tax=uncultured Deinococcus sp. TaxID=158789 RepID=UPI00258DD986|nr:hypothetical protein [uncultured Deinococcus sp.]